jgi:hypothetical protein
MTSTDFALRQAAAMMAARLRVFKRIAAQANETGTRVNLAPAELWEPCDETALAAYEDALNEINGARPLPMEISA